ncbi:hypothetical protein COU00_03625 [Candidatus Falkowbacteria bacterium CG10_big_fil_rev_8_21_14_0_10_43_11]|uniref:Methyltransferase type 11 domain-containing protein n=1 Tax=Candidatus Falkowbacteria bacterium CG10_big_fil_rev_8_21_14_0_10_43_11 TaxID=1974568 RepID=A0A2M6WL94_9BACT|nr:MAG: hypothetical protein COU00_03625 [Candidatus Falkowbacteria bacterium CG10_big_fil_rev_8_21_14_0_10_43_11]
MSENNFIKKSRGKTQKLKDFVTLPLRALAIFEENKWGLSSLQQERFEYAAREVKGYCLDVGCGKYNLFIKEFLNNNGVGIDVYKYEGLTNENIVKDITNFPFPNYSFVSITFIANLSHIPKSMRDKELAEAYRCLKKGGNIIITMPGAFASVIIHKIVYLYDKIFKTNYDVDNIRGMHEEEEYYLRDKEIIARLEAAGFTDIKKKYFLTQWGLNHLFTGRKRE